ncbi:hypothetical protein F1188_10935 [Roseospira marina]|uniref:Uncharacterized protein n=1 Tax=Roseospira marina TaxID=140057 RepID=A0A5M6IAZ8_9PROT|nr:hypothetical protein [Roseospira marina]KAA5605411.1 hypothetical protein F1188_10935 [Roseospira marina]MBB4314598.1 hypothetical protein [Roseospira marina]MBB5088797.1 hypothetical protein [Roseospira marina]
MTRVNVTQTNFTAGELSPDLYGRSDLRAYVNGAARLRNVFLRPTGGVARRDGLRHLATLPGRARLIAFTFNSEQTYLLVFTDGRMDVYLDGVKAFHTATPWDAWHLPGLSWTQMADTLLVVHPETAPRRITRASHTSWTIRTWTYPNEGQRYFEPYYRFANPLISLTPSDVVGAITLTASSPVFAPAHVGTRLLLRGKPVSITGYTAADAVTATLHEEIENAYATRDWVEQALSPVHGYARSVTFHQNRLVIGGSRDVPHHLWMSKVGDLFNFDTGEGLDDEAISFDLLSDQLNAIRAVFSAGDLEVFTSGAEWTISGSPLTPGALTARRQTRIGTLGPHTVPPRRVDGATLFVGATGRDLREYLFTDLENAYQAADLALLARHLIHDPVDMDYDPVRRLLHLVRSDGRLATMTNYRAEKVTAWTLQETDGAIQAVAEVGGAVYVAVERANGVSLERFDPALALDAALPGQATTPRTTWSGLGNLEGRTVRVLADGNDVGSAVVAGGAITLEGPARDVVVGLPFTHEIAPLPPSVSGGRGGGPGTLVRLIRATLRLQDTAALWLDTGAGPSIQPFRAFGGGPVLDQPPRPLSGDLSVRALGWQRDPMVPLWRVIQDAPLPCTVLSATLEVKVTD